MPAVCRKGHFDIPHCSGMVRFGSSENVRVNGIGVSREGHVNTPHKVPVGFFCVWHAAPITTGSTTVFVNGKGCGRIFDSIDGCTWVAEGSPNVFAGG